MLRKILIAYCAMWLPVRLGGQGEFKDCERTQRLHVPKESLAKTMFFWLRRVNTV